jgi:hypothetical protein
MKPIAWLLTIAVLVAVSPLAFSADKEPHRWDFERDEVDSVPAGFHAETGDWAIVEDEGNKVLAQRAKSPDKFFNVVLVRDFLARDVDLSVKFKAIAGNDDQAGGLVWRARDKNNYYVARYNPLENNFRVYKVEDGQRSMFKTADIAATPGWHTLRVTMRGDKIECFYDDKKYLEASDRTFMEAGKIGLWSKADAQTYFDDVEINE